MKDGFTFDFAFEENDDLAVGLAQVANLIYYAVKCCQVRALISILKHTLLANVPVNLCQLVHLEDLVDEPRVGHATNEHVDGEAIVTQVDVAARQSLPLE